jgi:hypothetical protein
MLSASRQLNHYDQKTNENRAALVSGLGLSPSIVIADLLPDLLSLSSYGEIPILCAASQWDVLDRIPEVLSEGRIAQEAPVLVFPQ